MDLGKVPESRQQRIVDSIKKKIKSEPSLVAEHLGAPPGVISVGRSKEREIYWTPDPEVMRDPQTFLDESAKAALATRQSEDEPIEQTLERASAFFAQRLYPQRLNVIRAGARSLSVNEQIKFAREMDKLGPPDDGVTENDASNTTGN